MKIKRGNCICGCKSFKKNDVKIGCFCHFGHLMIVLVFGCIGVGFLWIPIWILHACYDNEKYYCANNLCGRIEGAKE